MLPKFPPKPEYKALKEFYQDRHDGRITQEQLAEACDFWAVDYALKDLKYQPLPTCPIDLMKWGKLTSRQQEAVDEQVKSNMRQMSDGFWGNYKRIVTQNMTCLTQLMYVARTMKKYNNNIKLKTVEDRINDFTTRGVKPWGTSV